MDCKGILKTLDHYLRGESGKNVCTLIDEHLRGCKKCRMHVDREQRLIDLYRKWRPGGAPRGVRIRLNERISKEIGRTAKPARRKR